MGERSPYPILLPLLAALTLLAPQGAAAQGQQPDLSAAARRCFERADAMRGNGDYGAAVAACSEAIAEGSPNRDLQAELLLSRGVALREMSAFEAALADFNAALRLRPDANEIANMRAWTFRAMGDHAAAEAAYSEILTSDALKDRVPQDRVIWQAYLSRCVVRLDLARFDAAAGDCEAALQGSRNGDSLYFAARVYTEQGRCDEAVPLLEEALGLAEPWSRIFEELGYAYGCLDRKAEAIAVLDRGLARFPEDPGLLEMRRWAERL
jgi:tetratricopeptide (TPR) repeat protein